MRIHWILACLMALAIGCGTKKDGGEGTPKAGAAASKAPAAAEDPTAAAAKIFAQRCATCHGNSGKGDGPAGKALNPKPRDYSDAAWQASITDEKLAKTIVGGGTAVGLSPLMPPNPDLKDQPKVVDALVKTIRGFAKQ